MANLDISRISDQLTDAAVDANELSNDKSIVKLINNLDNIKDTCAAFGGKIAKDLPIRLKVEIDSLTGLYNQICVVSRSAAQNLKGLVEYMDSIPLGEIRKKSFMNIPNGDISSSVSSNSTFNVDDNGVEEQTPVEVTSTGSNEAPKSALLQQQESSDFWKNVRANVKRESYSYQRNTDEGEENGGVEFQRIKENLKDHKFDFGNLDEQMKINENLSGSPTWQGILSSLGKNQSSLNESIGREFDGKVDRGVPVHMVENEWNKDGVLGLGRMQESSMNESLLDDITILDN